MDKNFSNIEEIIADEQFLAWYFRSEDAGRQQWEQWMAANPHQASLVAEAKDYLDQLVIKEEAVPEAQVSNAERKLMTSIDEWEAANATSPFSEKTPVRRMARWWWAAAAALVVAVSGIWIFKPEEKPSSVQTAFGELREQQLPDGSKVTLNANTELKYTHGWEKGKEREVWIRGEAFFHVAKTPEKSRFVVHTDRFDVVVTGTQFNVVNREDKANIMLTEGSVTLHTPDGKTYNMVPGDFVEVNNQQLEKKAGREENVLAWKEKKLYFDNTPLYIALEKIEEHYGVKVTIGNINCRNVPISGILPNDNLNVLLDALDALYEFHVIRKNGEIIITQ